MSSRLSHHQTCAPLFRQAELPFQSGEVAQTRSHHRRKRGKERATAEAIETFKNVRKWRSKLYLPLLGVIAAHGPAPEDCLTAREVLGILKARGILSPTAERNAIAPRMTELSQAGCIERLDYLKRTGIDAPAHTWRICPRGLLLTEELRRAARPKT